MKNMILFLTTSCALVPSAATAKHLVNTTHQGLALQGYDPVTFIDDQKAVPGSFQHEAHHDGATYRFSSKATRRRFQEQPEKYVPQYGGFCAYAASFGKLAPVAIETWTVIDGKLYLQKNKDVAKRFRKEGPEKFIEAADEQWPKLLEARGTELTAAQVTRRGDITLEAAKKLAEAGWAHASANNAPGGAIAVTDSGGHLLYLIRVDGTFGAAARVATEKARTAALFRFPSKLLEDAIIKGRTSLVTVGHNMLRGGLPIFFSGEVVGGIGVSGAASADQDVEIAEAALELGFEGSK
ncbi:MAG: YHS domain-containing (seleno)protein [Myxococcota bacterium]